MLKLSIRAFATAVLVLCSVIAHAAPAPHPVKVGSEIEFAPFAFVDEKGQPVGFSVDLIKAVANSMGLQVQISTGPWDTVWNQLVSGQFDVLPLVAKFPERLPQVDFGLTHTETFDAFFVRKGTPPIPNLAAAEGKAIVVMKSDAAHHALLDQKFKGKIVTAETIPQALSLVASGQYDAALCSKLIGIIAINTNGIKGLTAGPPIPDYKRSFSFAVSKGTPELLEKLNQGLLIIKSNGEYARIYEKWLKVDDPWLKQRKYFLYALGGVGIVASIALSLAFFFRHAVRRRTIELSQANEELLQHKSNLNSIVDQRTRELKQSEARFRSYFELPIAGIAITSQDKGWIVINDQLCNMLGYSHEELHAKTWAELTHPEDLDLDVEQFNRVLAGEIEGYTLDKRFVTKNGEPIWTLLSVRGVRLPDGRVDYFVAVLFDLSARKKAESELVAAKEIAENALRVKSRFLDIAAHELRTPVTGFSLLLQFAQMQLEKKGVAVDVATLARLRTQANHLSRLVVDLLDVSRLERGVLTLKRELTNLVSLVSGCLDNARLQTPPRRFTWIEPGQPIELNLDHDRIIQVLSNLLDNAIKYTPSDTPIEVVVEIDSDFARVAVTDHGPGIDEKLQATLFNPFARGTGNQEEQVGGLGLGLYVCRGIIALHGGKIGVQSKPGVGSTFYFELPRSVAAIRAA